MLYQLSVHLCTVAIMQSLSFVCIPTVCACVCVYSEFCIACRQYILASNSFSLYCNAVPWLQHLTPHTLPPPLTLQSLYHHYLVGLLQLVLYVLLPDKYQTHTLTHLVRAFQWRVAAMIPLCFHICMSPPYRNYKGTGANC